MASRAPAGGDLELWGGVECTVNRIGDRYRDQTRLSGHHDRLDDLGRIAALGVRRLRYPVLWERVAPDRPEDRDWRWSDQRLTRLRELDVKPIVGLLHHGSGPRYTSLLDPAFPALLGDYAGAVAVRYPDVNDWTPVNEPLTTARFSALYGHWYPHARDERLFWTAMLNQIDGTRAAMRAIREINGEARLIQTEDLGRCYATAAKLPVAEHYNERRWMTWDLLAGRVTRQHPLWETLDRCGLADRLRSIADDPCPPDLLGVNHYVTSDRFLDDRAHGEPLPEVGYHDIAAVRALAAPPAGLAGALTEAWSRYGRPLAVTECHLSCTREEQLRWIAQAWTTCGTLRRDGIDVQALTAWALFGSFDWDSLLTREVGSYESGAFDVRSGTPRATAVAALLPSLAVGAALPEWIKTVVGERGWWHRDVRFETFANPAAGGASWPSSDPRSTPLLITGAAGTMGQAFARLCRLRGLAHVLTNVALDDPDTIAAVLDAHRPWAVVDAAAWVRGGEAEDHVVADYGTDADGSSELARACTARGIYCMLFSLEFLLNGNDAPNGGEACARQLRVYGASEAAAEQPTAMVNDDVPMVHNAAFLLPDDPPNLATAVERGVVAGKPSGEPVDHEVMPTYLFDLIQACLDRLIDDATEFWHLTNGEAVSWLTLDHSVAAAFEVKPHARLPSLALASTK